MTHADQLFVENCKTILETPYTDAGVKGGVRPHWPDGTPAHTKKIFGVCDRYDLQREFPMMTLRRCYWKTALQEVLWIYQKQSNVISELGSHIWDQWDTGDGTIGKAYGYQIAQTTNYKEGPMDQMSRVLYDLEHTPMSRSIMTNMYNMGDLPEMGLRPCAYSMTYNVTRDPTDGSLVLNGMLNQRSQDMLTANGWNVVQYAMLLMMVARHAHMKPGIFLHVIADCHIYDRHIPIIEEMIAHSQENAFVAPRVYIKDEAPTNFWQMSVDDFVVSDYQYQYFGHTVEVAI
jgi:thymidylate synthase